MLDALPPRAVGPEVKRVTREALGRQEVRRSAELSHAAQARLEQRLRVVDVEAELSPARGKPTGHAQQRGPVRLGWAPLQAQSAARPQLRHCSTAKR